MILMLFDEVTVQVFDVTDSLKNVPATLAFESMRVVIFVAVPPDTEIESYLLYGMSDD